MSVASIFKREGARTTTAFFAALLGCAVVTVLVMASSAKATELIYWDNYTGTPDSVSVANIDGTGGGSLNLGGVELNNPEGMALDPLTGQLFVTSPGSGTNGQILAVNLDGSGATVFNPAGAPVDTPEGIAVDPVTGTLYWANDSSTPSIAWAKLDGSAGGVLNTTGATLSGPCCRIAIDPSGGRIYWVNNPSPVISYTNLNNTGGGGDLNLTGSTVTPGGEGLAVDNATGRLYFLGGSDELGFANLNGSGGGNVSILAGVVNDTWGLAFDPSLSRLYWGNESNSTSRENAIGFAGLSGGGGGITIATAPVAGPQDPVILKNPAGTGVPAVTRSTKSRSALACSTGSWGVDYPGSFVYEAPRTFAYQWVRNGTAVGGAVGSTYTAKSAGKYVCTVTATNQAGSAIQASAAISVKAAKVKLTTKKKATVKAGGVAKFKIKGLNQGDLQTKKVRVCAKLPKKAKGVLKASKCATLGKLKGRGKKGAILKTAVAKSAPAGTYKVTFTAHGSAGKSATAKVIVK